MILTILYRLIFIPWTEEAGGLESIGSDMTEATQHAHTL